MDWLRWTLFLPFLTLATAQAVSSSQVSTVTGSEVSNGTLAGRPGNTTVATIPDVDECDYSSGDDLYCFPYKNAFVTMTGWTRFFYNRNFGLINNSGLVDITMHFAADDAPAASWIGVQNTGNIPINVNISWFTSTLAPTATNSAADPYYFYVRPNSAVYNAYATVSSRGPTFYAVQTPVQRLVVAASASNTQSTTSTTQASSRTSASSSATETGANGNQSSQSSGLGKGAIAGIAIGAIALFFVLLLLGIVIVLLLRRNRYAEIAAAAAAENEEKRRNRGLAPGNLYTPEELAAASLNMPRHRPQTELTDSSNSVPSVTNINPLMNFPEVPPRSRWLCNDPPVRFL